MRLGRALIIALLVSLAGAAAHAGKGTSAEVRAHYERGMARYSIGDFEGAIVSFKQAYEISNAPGFLFNLAQSSRLAKKHADALHFYRTYLRLRPNAPNRKDVLAFIAKLEPVVAREAATARVEPAPAEGTPAAPVEPPPAPAPVPEPVRVERRPDPPAARLDLTPPPSRTAPKAGGRGMMIGGAVTAAVGVAALATGIAFGVNAASAQQQVDDLAAGRGTWSASSQRLFDEGQRDANVATALYAAGGALAGVGTVLAIVGWRRTVAQRRYSLTPQVGATVAATFSCDF